MCLFFFFFFFKQKTAYEMRISDWSSDVCSSDLVEGGLERGELFDRGIGTQDVVARHAAEAHHQVVEETTVVGGGKLVVRSHGQLVLRIARDVPLLGPVLAVVAHALAGAPPGDAGELGLAFADAEALERGQPVAPAFSSRGRQKPPVPPRAVDHSTPQVV